MSVWAGPGGIRADELAIALGLPTPTPEQRGVIEAPPTPALVVAGAGSGKTETMSARVVWLVANGHVRRDEVLGLTFTRKAAGELAERIDRRLATVDEYARRGLLPHIPALVGSGELTAFWTEVDEAPPRVRQLALTAFLDAAAARCGAIAPASSADEDLLLRPRVATYNSFADAIVREHGARIGRDPDAVLMSPSASWLLARRVVVASTDARLSQRPEGFSTIVEAVHTLAGEVLDNRADLGEVAALGDRLAAAVGPLTNPDLANPGDLEKFERAMSGLAVLTDLVREYARRKQEEDTLDFADQVAGALQIVEQAPDAAATLRAQYRVVLLDEYQDTSVIQTRLLSEVFHDGAVMAVGDPNQSIYAWRGASADNLTAFPAAFARQTPCEHHGLLVSWRNDVDVLVAANRLVSGEAGPGAVGELRPRPGAGRGRVGARFLPTIEEEADEVARWFVEVRAEHARAQSMLAAERLALGEAPREPKAHSGAVLFRAKRHMNAFAEALGRHGVPHRILGLGGLLGTPEVVDVVSALRVVHDPSQGSALIRLLAGPRFAVGVADLAALQALADTLSRRDGSLAPLDPELAARVRGSAGIDEQLSIIDALEFVRTARPGSSLVRGFTETGVLRMREAAEMFARLRRAVGQPVPDLIRLIEAELRLDIELAANETRGAARVASAQLRAFLDEVRAFLDADDRGSIGVERGSIGSLLAWLEHAEDTDELMPRAEPPQPGVVQLLTIHGSKGLEWDAVAVVRLVERELPKDPKSKLGWLGFGTLPYAFRGDRDALPSLDWRPGDEGGAKALRSAITAFKAKNGAHQEAEERRLAYVAVTRARSDLLLTGAQWGGQLSARGPSAYLVEMVDALGLDPLEPGDPGDNPYLDRGGQIVTWPLDALGDRRAVVTAAARRVTERAGEVPAPVPDDDLDRLLAERASRAAGPVLAAPARIPASRFKDYVTDHAATLAAVARPMPERPFRQTRLGTLFHAWVENRSGVAGIGGSPDDALWELDEFEPDTEASVADVAELARLQAIFERSEWAGLAPLEVETEIDFALGEDRRHVVICKLDAVYRRHDRGGRIEIVDWKTGRPPKDGAERDERMLQLALYRLAYHRRHGVPLEEIDVALYYVGDDLVIRSDEVLDEAALAERWESAARAADRRVTT